MRGILQIICEIYQFSQNPQNTLTGSEEIKLEIELLFKALQVQNINQIGSSSALKASQTCQFASLLQEIELSYLFQMCQILQPHLLVAESKQIEGGDMLQQADQ
jgi:hypothetical protein